VIAIDCYAGCHNGPQEPAQAAGAASLNSAQILQRGDVDPPAKSLAISPTQPIQGEIPDFIVSLYELLQNSTCTVLGFISEFGQPRPSTRYSASLKARSRK
jgi:hypothetical protein